MLVSGRVIPASQSPAIDLVSPSRGGKRVLIREKQAISRPFAGLCLRQIGSLPVKHMGFLRIPIWCLKEVKVTAIHLIATAARLQKHFTCTTLKVASGVSLAKELFAPVHWYQTLALFHGWPFRSILPHLGQTWGSKKHREEGNRTAAEIRGMMLGLVHGYHFARRCGQQSPFPNHKQPWVSAQARLRTRAAKIGKPFGIRVLVMLVYVTWILPMPMSAKTPSRSPSALLHFQLPVKLTCPSAFT